MTTFLRNWTNYQNQVPADQSTLEKQAQSILWAVKDKLVTAGWTVTQSSDSVTADGTDNWTTSANLVWGTGAHSWVVLKSPNNFPSTGENTYFAIDLANANKYQVSLRLATADWTGGTTSSIGTGTNAVSWANQQFLKSTLANAKWHLHVSSEGDVVWYVSRDSAGYAAFGYMAVACTDTQSGDDWPIYEFANFLESGVGAFEDDEFASTVHIRGHWIDGVADPDTVMVWPNRAGSSTPITDSFDANGDDNGGKYPAFPLYAVSVATGKVSFRGRIYDLRAAPSNNAIVQGTTEPVGGPVSAAIVGQLWLPADTAPSF